MPRVPGLVLTPEQKKIVEAVRAEIERDKPQLIEEAKRVDAALEKAEVHLRNAFQLLQAVRKSQGTTLTAVAQATGIDKSTLRKLENDPAANVTLSTLMRVAEALRHDLLISIAPRSSAAKSKPKTRHAGK